MTSRCCPPGTPCWQRSSSARLCPVGLLEPSRPLEGGHRQAGSLELLPEVLGQLTRAAPNDCLAVVMDALRQLMAPIEADPRQNPRQRLGYVIEGVVVIVAYDHPPVATQPGARPSAARPLDRRRGHPRIMRKFHQSKVVR